MPESERTRPEDRVVRLLDADGTRVRDAATEQYDGVVDALPDDELLAWYRDMVRTRHLDREGFALQRQGYLALWIPSLGHEAAHVGSARAAAPQDMIFPSFREHGAALVRGVDATGIMRVMGGYAHGGWDPAAVGFHLYAVVLGSQVLHATGYALGARLDALGARLDAMDALESTAPRPAVLVYFGDGASSEGDVSESLDLARTYRTPQVFFLVNNGWAISTPTSAQSPVPLVRRARGFGIDGVRIDGNDVLAAYAATKTHLDRARENGGPCLIEAVTYRMGPHTSSDDDTRYRTRAEVDAWQGRDPISRFATFLRGRGCAESFFTDAEQEAKAFADDVRRRVVALEPPPAEAVFDHVYAQGHPLVSEDRARYLEYRRSMAEP